MKKVYGWSFVGLMCVCSTTWGQAQSGSSSTKNGQGSSTQGGTSTTQSGTQPGTKSGTQARTQSGTQSRTPAGTQSAKQLQTQSGTQTTTYHSGSAAQGTADQQIAAVLACGAEKEVELAKLAKERAQAEEVKQFATKMISDHTQQLEKLRREAGSLAGRSGTRTGTTSEIERQSSRSQTETDTDGSTNNDSTNNNATNKNATNKNAANNKETSQDDRKEAREDRREGRQSTKSTTDREQRREGQQATRSDQNDTRQDRTDERDVRTTTVTTAGHGLNWVNIHREVCDRCLESAKEELSSKNGHEFDMCYMGMQVAAHMEMRDKLNVLKNYATSELQQNIQQDIQTVEHHLADARRILGQIKDGDSSSSRSTTSESSTKGSTNSRSNSKDSSTKESANPRAKPSGASNPGSANSSDSAAPGNK